MQRVVIADDHQLVRKGIRVLLEKYGGVEVVGEAANGLEAIELVEKLIPDFAIMDIAMPQLDGIQATEHIRNLGIKTRIIILSMHSHIGIVQEVLRKGAKGYLMKDSLGEELVLAIQAASKDQIYLSPGVSGDLLNNLWELEKEMGTVTMADKLTPRQRQILQLVAEGYTNSEIAEKLVISVKTVEKHRSNLMSTLRVSDISSLIKTAIKHNLIFDI